MAPRSSIIREPAGLPRGKAFTADQQAAAAPTRTPAEHWRHIAETYRWIGYYRRAMGRWRPNPEDGGWGPL